MDRGYKIPPHILDDLCSRFILNVPEDNRDAKIRLFFQIELAHWFYIDFFVAEDAKLKIVGIKDFAHQVFKHCPFLNTESDDLDTMHQDWKKYKLTVPTYGGILIDPDYEHVLLVQGFSKSWGFPKGKVNEKEEPEKCAIRELLEETGFDASSLLNKEHYVEHTVGDMYSRLYIIPDIPLHTCFHPYTRNEIKAMNWFPIKYLPTHKKDVSHITELGCGPNAFFMVIPYVKQLKRWIHQKQTGTLPTIPKYHKRDNKPMSDTQKMFAHRNLQEFEKMLNASPSTHETAEKLTSTRIGGKGNRIASPHKGQRGISQSPQHSMMDKRDKNLKKVADRRRELDSSPVGSPRMPVYIVPRISEKGFSPCNAWNSFQFDIEAIMSAAKLS